MKQKRLVGYIDEDQHDELMESLRKEGMTLAGWLRKMVRLYLKKKRDEEAEQD